MEPVDYVVILVILLILGGAALYVYRAKKNGQKCVGCPHAKSCPHAKNGCGCGCDHSSVKPQ